MCCQISEPCPISPTNENQMFVVMFLNSEIFCFSILCFS